MAALILAVVVVLQAIDVVFGQGLFFSHDLKHHHFPWRFWAAEGWASGMVPLWSPEVGNGFPLMADGQTGVLYPPNIFLGALLPTQWSLSWSLLLHQWWAGLGAFFLMRSLRPEAPVSWEAALFAGVAFALGGSVVGRFTYAGMLQVVSWMPWAWWSLIRLAQSPNGARTAVWAGCVACLMTAGHPQVGAAGLLSGLVVFAGQRAVLKTWIWAGCGALLGLSAALPQLLASLELASLSSRTGGVDAGFANMGALPPQELINAVLPHFWGWEPPATLPLTYVHKAAGYFGTGENHWESCFYLGVPVVFFAAWAMFCLRGQKLWKGLAVGALLLSLGALTPLYGLLRAVPGFDYFRFPARFTIVASLALVVLASLALDELMSEKSQKSRRRFAWVLRICVALGVLGMFGVRSLLQGGSENLIEGLSKSTGDPARAEGFVFGLLDSLNPASGPNLTAILVAMGVVFLLGARSRGLEASWVARAVVLLVVVDLSVFGMDYNPASPPGEASRAPSSQALLDEVSAEGLGRMAVVDRVQVPDLDHELLSASLGLVWGAQEVAVLSPLVLPDSEALLAQAGLNVGMDHGPKKVFDALAHLHLVDLMGVELLYSVHLLPDPQLILRQVSNGVLVYENEGAMDRAFVVGEVRSADTAQAALEAMATPFDPRRLAYAEDHEGMTAGGVGSVDMLEYTSHRVEMSTELSAPGFLVLSDTWYPGWQATVNGEAAVIYKANSVFRGVNVPSGSSQVVMEYRPSWGWTLKLWAVAWMGILVILIRSGWRARQAAV